MPWTSICVQLLTHERVRPTGHSCTCRQHFSGMCNVSATIQLTYCVLKKVQLNAYLHDKSGPTFSCTRHKVDPDVPYVWNDDKLNRFTKTSGTRNPSAHAYAMLHYRNLDCDAGAGRVGLWMGLCVFACYVLRLNRIFILYINLSTLVKKIQCTKRMILNNAKPSAMTHSTI